MPKPTLADLAREASRRRLPQKKRNAALRAAGYDPGGADGVEYRKLLHRFMTADTRQDVVLLWTFPAEDFTAWQELVPGGPLECHADYMALVAAAEGELRRAGHETRRVPLPVKDMLARLANHGLPNEPSGRAAALGLND